MMSNKIPKSDLIIAINHCKTLPELTALWNTLTKTEQITLKKFFTERKGEIKNETKK